METLTLTRILLLSMGTIFVGFGAVGVFLPVIPTTPFLLLAAACYARSSDRFYKRLLANPVFGQSIRDYHEGKGITRRSKILSISMLIATITLSAFVFVEGIRVRVLLMIIAIAVSLYIMSIKTHYDSEQAP